MTTCCGPCNAFNVNYFLELTASTTTGSTTTTVAPNQPITVQPGQAITVHVTDGMTGVVIPDAQVAPVSTNPANGYETVDTSDPSAVTPTGTVSYSYYTNGSCTAPAQSTQTVMLNADGSVPDSSTTAALDPGSYSYRASYSGDAIYPASTGPCEPFTVAKGSQTITFTSSLPNPASIGGSYTPAATGGASGNQVVFSIDPSSGAGVCSISNSGTVSFTGVGTCLIDANQAANADDNAGQAQQSVTVAKDPTTTSLAASVNSALTTQAVTFTATVTPAPDDGTIAFDDGTSAIAGCGSVNLTGGSATCHTSSLPLGSDQITAVYSGDANYEGSLEPAGADRDGDRRYKQGVAVLQAQGWLTAAQASTPDGLAANLQT